jgi:hypothetical protein
VLLHLVRSAGNTRNPLSLPLNPPRIPFTYVLILVQIKEAAPTKRASSLAVIGENLMRRFSSFSAGELSPPQQREVKPSSLKLERKKARSSNKVTETSKLKYPRRDFTSVPARQT